MPIETIDSTRFYPEKLRENFELYPKVIEITNHIIDGFFTEFDDTKFKYRGPDVVREEVIKEIIEERGFGYIKSIMDTISNFEFNVLLDFLGLINLLKGSRQGLELILKILGMDAVVTEWWEQSPQAAPQTYVITILMNTSYIADPLVTLEAIIVFCKHYVYPIIENIDFKFQLVFATANANFAGFGKSRYSGQIIGAAV